MKYFRLIVLLLFAIPVFGQKIYKEPVATPAPFELHQNFNLENVVQSLAKSATVGDTTFFIRKNLREDNVKLESVDFYKHYEDDLIVVYSECDEYDDGRVTDETISNIVNSLLNETPEKSPDPQKGMLEHLNDLFGEFPDVDGNGKLFVLLIDARDEYDPDTDYSYVAGYFDPIDQSKSKGNYSDIIYIDTNPANSTDDHTLGVVAHELQHLIHYNYDKNESTWLNEGFSELAPQLLGYESHSYSRFLSATNRKLTEFDGSLLDYSKVALWTFYIYKRFGIDLIHEVLRNPSNSTISYEESLQSMGYSLTFNELLSDWFIANLINNPSLENGKYSYNGEYIPGIESEFFHSNFTEGKIIQGELAPQAAQYIQFDGGRNINLSLDVEIHSLAELTEIKYKSPIEINKIDISSGEYNLEDLDFGTDYSKLSLVLGWTALLSNSQSLDFSYSALGVGGYEEFELFNDSDTVDFYVALTAKHQAAQKFHTEMESEMVGIKFNCGTSNPVDIRLYADLTRNPFQTFYDINCNAQDWTLYQLQNPIPLSEDATYYISITSANSNGFNMGYSNNGNGNGWAFLKNGNNFQDLDNFQIDNGSLDGNWTIHSINRREIFKEAELVVEPDTLIFIDSDTIQKTINIKNIGTEVLKWRAISKSPMLSLSDSVGMLASGMTSVEVIPDFSNIYSGLYESDLIIQSDLNSDSVHTIIIKRNTETPQTAFLLPTDIFHKNRIKMKVFNIGTGSGEYNIKEYPSYLAINPANELIPADDTLIVDLMIDSSRVTAESFGFVFENGIGEMYRSLKYPRQIGENSKESLKIYVPSPNPFNPKRDKYANILVQLKNSKSSKIKIYNINGEIVRIIKVNNPRKGLQLVSWDGRSIHGNFVHSGLYFVELQQGNSKKVSKMLVIK